MDLYSYNILLCEYTQYVQYTMLYVDTGCKIQGGDIIIYSRVVDFYYLYTFVHCTYLVTVNDREHSYLFLCVFDSVFTFLFKKTKFDKNLRVVTAYVFEFVFTRMIQYVTTEFPVRINSISFLPSPTSAWPVFEVH
jgi:hypothetical protein